MTTLAGIGWNPCPPWIGILEGSTRSRDTGGSTREMRDVVEAGLNEAASGRTGYGYWTPKVRSASALMRICRAVGSGGSRVISLPRRHEHWQQHHGVVEGKRVGEAFCWQRRSSRIAGAAAVLERSADAGTRAPVMSCHTKRVRPAWAIARAWRSPACGRRSKGRYRAIDRSAEHSAPGSRRVL